MFTAEDYVLILQGYLDNCSDFEVTTTTSLSNRTALNLAYHVRLYTHSTRKDGLGTKL